MTLIEKCNNAATDKKKTSWEVEKGKKKEKKTINNQDKRQKNQ